MSLLAPMAAWATGTMTVSTWTYCWLAQPVGHPTNRTLLALPIARRRALRGWHPLNARWLALLNARWLALRVLRQPVASLLSPPVAR